MQWDSWGTLRAPFRSVAVNFRCDQSVCCVLVSSLGSLCGCRYRVGRDWDLTGDCLLSVEYHTVRQRSGENLQVSDYRTDH